MADKVGGNYWCVECSQGTAYIFVADTIALGQQVFLMPPDMEQLVCVDRMMDPRERAFYIAKYDGTWGTPLRVLGKAWDYTPSQRGRRRKEQA